MRLVPEHHGHGRNLALIHGWGFSSAIWHPLIPLLQNHCRIHLLDLPGYGVSHDTNPGNLNDIADLVAAALPEDSILCGWSLGAQIAVTMLNRNSKFTGLITVSATPAFAQKEDWPHGMSPDLLDDFDQRLQQDPTALLLRFATLVNRGDKNARELTRQITPLVQNTPTNKTTLQHGLTLLRETDLRPLLPQLTHPTLILHGDTDPLTPHTAATWMSQTLPNAELEVFEGAAHVPFLSQPKRFVERLTRFIDHH